MALLKPSVLLRLSVIEKRDYSTKLSHLHTMKRLRFVGLRLEHLAMLVEQLRTLGVKWQVHERGVDVTYL